MIEVYLVFILDYVDLIPHCREDSVVLIASSMLLAWDMNRQSDIYYNFAASEYMNSL